MTHRMRSGLTTVASNVRKERTIERLDADSLQDDVITANTSPHWQLEGPSRVQEDDLLLF